MSTIEQQPKSFKDFNIEPSNLKHFIGKKIEMYNVLNREITVFEHKIEKSKYPKSEDDKCLYLQIEIDNEKRVLFSGSKVLQDTIEKIAPTNFPFRTTIKKINEHFEFT